MSSESRVARRYARAIFELIEEGATTLRQPLADLAEVAAMEDVATLLSNSTIPASVKKRILCATVTELPAELERLLTILTGRNKLTLLVLIGQQVDTMLQANASTVDVELIVATRITAALRNRIAVALEGTVGKALNIEVHQHKSIIGGFIVNVGDRRIDQSVRSRLNGLRAIMAG
ncbi:MAG: ATP synthase F1 subunit delta [Mariprofundales bacterium]|nr:ATP synthase F1 subunit delta [Mariprofundales bacterium]